MHAERTDVIVIGAGLAGLTAAAYAARGGRAVLLCERAGEPGGRAQTTTAGEFRFNLGPHALYRGGPAERALRELDVVVQGGRPSPSGAFAVANGQAHALPGGFLSLLTTGLFGLPAKLETARLLGGLGRLDPEPLQHTSVEAWLATAIRHREVRALLGALVRVSSYAADHSRMSAGAALAQIQAALGAGVRYLDGGWQTLVDALRATAEAAGVRVRTAARAERVVCEDGTRVVRLADGTRLSADAVILAVPPDSARTLLADSAAAAAAAAWATAAEPVRAACLDLGLARLPRPRALFALGIDRPLYLSVHSASAARLAPDGAAMVHVAKYLRPDEGEARADERELEGLLDLVQPGWRAEVRERRFLPNMLVTPALPTAAQGGLRGRPAVTVPGLDGLYLAGDWVGGEGMLAEASFASARAAAERVLARMVASRAAA